MKKWNIKPDSDPASGGLRGETNMATFIRIRDNDREIRYVNRDLIDTFDYDRVNNTTKIGFVGDLHAYLEIDGDITDVILNPKKQELEDLFRRESKNGHKLEGETTI